MIQFGEDSLPTFTLPKMVKRVKVYPGIKDLPAHLQDFRNSFIRYVIRQVANSESPWINPDVKSLQVMYDAVYPSFPARIRHNDAVYHPVSDLSPMIPYNANLNIRPCQLLGFSETTLLLLPSLPFHNTLATCSAKRSSILLRLGPNMLMSFSSRKTTIQSYGANTPRVIFKTTLKLEGIKLYAISFITPPPPLTILPRQDAVFSSQILSWQHFAATTPHLALWNHPRSKTQELEAGRSVSLPLQVPPYVLPCFINNVILIFPFDRLNVHTRCTRQGILFLLASHSTLKTGANLLRHTWITLSATSLKSIGTPFLFHSPPSLCGL